MSSTQLRQYIDILKEQENSDFFNFGFGNSTPADTEPSTKKIPPEAAPADKAPETEPGPKEEPKLADTTSNDVLSLQQALTAAGFQLPKFGEDGKMGPETQAAIKAAEMVLGRTPTGNITVKEIETIKKKGAATDNNSLANALDAIEAVLAKYKIKTESIEEEIDAYILENINKYSQQEQIEIWRTLTEEDKPRLPPGAKFDRATGNYYTTSPTGAKTYLGVLSPKQSKLAKFAGKLGGIKGIGKKIAGRAAATALSGPAALAVGAGLTAWTAYDIGKALYDTFTSTDIGDLDPADQQIITSNLKTVMAYEKDPKMMASLPNELQFRVSNVIKGLKALSVEDSTEKEEPKKSSTTTSPHPRKPGETPPYLPPNTKVTTTNSERKIAGEPVVPGQPLSQKQMAVMQLAIDSGNRYPPEIMAQYNKQKQTS